METTQYLQLNQFSSYFELFTAFCFAYAGSATFRHWVDDLFGIEKMSEDVKVLLEERKARLTVGTALSEYAIVAELDLEVEDVLKEKTEFAEFPTGCKSMFLLTALFNTTVLLLMGLQQAFIPQDDVFLILFCCNSVLFYNLWRYFKSFDKSKCGTDTTFLTVICWWTIPMIIGLIIYGAASIFEGLWLHSSAFFKWTALVGALLVAPSPFLLHLVRATHHQETYEKKLRVLLQQLDRQASIAARANNLFDNAQQNHISEMPQVVVPSPSQPNVATENHQSPVPSPPLQNQTMEDQQSPPVNPTG